MSNRCRFVNSIAFTHPDNPDDNDPLFVVEKINAIQHARYMKVRQLACACCGIARGIQFSHADEGKGTGIKTHCRRGWPGCGPHDDSMGCLSWWACRER